MNERGVMRFTNAVVRECKTSFMFPFTGNKQAEWATPAC